jgi:hypothetical protein
VSGVRVSSFLDCQTVAAKALCPAKSRGVA